MIFSLGKETSNINLMACWRRGILHSSNDRQVSFKSNQIICSGQHLISQIIN